MRTVMVRYKVKPDRAAENEELARAVYEELHRTEPSGLRYATFRLDDGVTFVHVAAVDADAGNPLTQTEAFGRFIEGIGERCEEAPVTSTIEQIGSFNFFSA